MLKCEDCKKDLKDDYVIVYDEDNHDISFYCYDCFHKILNYLIDEFIYKVGEEGGESNETDQVI